jgi:hypothetical protein
MQASRPAEVQEKEIITISEKVFTAAPMREPERKREEEPVKTFSSKISDIKYDDEYDIPAFLRKKMEKK